MNYEIASTLYIVFLAGLVFLPYYMMKRQATKADVQAFMAMGVAAVFGEVLMILAIKGSDVLVHRLARETHDRWLVYTQWPIAVTVITVVGYVVFGRHVLQAFAKSNDVAPDNDLRVRFGVKLLSKTSWPVFICASVIGGSPAIAWYYGRKHDPRAKKLTFLAALILAISANAFYLGLFSHLLRSFILWTALAVVVVGGGVALWRHHEQSEQQLYNSKPTELGR